MFKPISIVVYPLAIHLCFSYGSLRMTRQQGDEHQPRVPLFIARPWPVTFFRMGWRAGTSHACYWDQLSDHGPSALVTYDAHSGSASWFLKISQRIIYIVIRKRDQSVIYIQETHFLKRNFHHLFSVEAMHHEDSTWFNPQMSPQKCVYSGRIWTDNNYFHQYPLSNPTWCSEALVLKGSFIRENLSTEPNIAAEFPWPPVGCKQRGSWSTCCCLQVERCLCQLRLGRSVRCSKNGVRYTFVPSRICNLYIHLLYSRENDDQP